MTAELRALGREVEIAVSRGRVSEPQASRLLGEAVLILVKAPRAPSLEVWRQELEAGGVDEGVLGAFCDRLLPTASEQVVREGAADSDGDAQRVLKHVRAVLGDPATWAAAAQYGGSGLAVIDAIWSIGVRYTGVLNVVERYREARRAEGHDADQDGPAELAAWIERVGGPEGFAAAVANRQRTSSRSGILKAEAVHFAAVALEQLGMSEPADFVSASPAQVQALTERWTAIRGQGSGLSLEYFLMLSGVPGVKADRMVRRFVAAAVGEATSVSVGPARAATAVKQAARELAVDERDLDYAIWRYESGQ